MLEEGFETYVPPLKGYLLHGIRNAAEVETCKICIGVVGDLYRNLGQKKDGSGSPMLKDTVEIMTALLQTYYKAGVDQTTKPHILACFGDIAMSIGGSQFIQFADPVLEAIKQATVAAASNTSEEEYDVIDNTNDLRDGCLEAYTGILIALKGDIQPGQPPNANVGKLYPATCQHMVAFMTQIMLDTECSDKVLRSAVGLVGDLIDTYQQIGADGRPLCTAILPPQFCAQLVAKAVQSSEEATQRLGRWAQQLMKKVGIVV